MILREADVVNEADLLSAVAKASFDFSVAPGYSSEGIQTFHNVIIPNRLVDRKDQHVWFVAELDNQIVAVIEWRLAGHVKLFFTLPSHQGKGIGTQLFDFALKTMQKRLPDTEKITVYASPNAETTYIRLGFVRTADPRIESGMTVIPMALVLD